MKVRGLMISTRPLQLNFIAGMLNSKGFRVDMALTCIKSLGELGRIGGYFIKRDGTCLLMKRTRLGVRLVVLEATHTPIASIEESWLRRLNPWEFSLLLDRSLRMAQGYIKRGNIVKEP